MSGGSRRTPVSGDTRPVDYHDWVEEHSPGRYCLRMSCTNCHAEWAGQFYRGYRALGYFECPKCGCYTGIAHGLSDQPKAPR